MTGKPAAVPDKAQARAAAPDGYDILILDAGYKQSLAAVRSLGRAGLRVAMAECFIEADPSLPVLAFRSRYSARNVVLPSCAADGGPSPGRSSSSSASIRRASSCPTVTALSPLWCPCGISLPSWAACSPWRPDSALEVANDKDRTLEVARKLGIDQPKTMRMDSIDEVPNVLAEFEFPFVLKPTISWTAQSDIRLAPIEVINQAEVLAATRSSSPLASACSPSSGPAVGAKASRCSSSTARSWPPARTRPTAPARAGRRLGHAAKHPDSSGIYSVVRAAGDGYRPGGSVRGGIPAGARIARC